MEGGSKDTSTRSGTAPRNFVSTRLLAAAVASLIVAGGRCQRKNDSCRHQMTDCRTYGRAVAGNIHAKTWLDCYSFVAGTCCILVGRQCAELFAALGTGHSQPLPAVPSAAVPDAAAPDAAAPDQYSPNAAAPAGSTSDFEQLPSSIALSLPEYSLAGLTNGDIADQFASYLSTPALSCLQW